MIVKELFTSITFEEIAAALRRTHHSDSSIRKMASYKEAYDEICHTEFKGDGGNVIFDLTESTDFSDVPMLANNVEGDYWENTVGKTVVFPDSNPFTKAELAGSILWGMTFYGFSQLKKWNPREVPFGKYGEMTHRLQCKLYLPYLRDKKQITQLKRRDADYQVAFTFENWAKIWHGMKHQNRSKRMRFHRIENRIEQLERLAHRDELLAHLSEMIGAEVDYLRPQIMNAAKMQVIIRESRSCGEAARLDYLAELITRYNGLHCEECENYSDMTVVVTTSPQNPTAEHEKQALAQLFSAQAVTQGMSLKFIYGTESSLPDSEMNLRIILTSPQEKKHRPKR